jgi:hypothetical protein
MQRGWNGGPLRRHSPLLPPACRAKARSSLDWRAGRAGRFRGPIREPAHAQLNPKPSQDIPDPVGPIGPVSAA